jgi:hypothetical protein
MHYTHRAAGVITYSSFLHASGRNPGKNGLSNKSRIFMSTASPIIVALDFPSEKETLQLVDRLLPETCRL